MKTLPVMFRVDRPTGAGVFPEVTAVFPTLPGSGVIGQFPTCYAHVGQHGSCSRNWISQCTRPATPEEYAPLLRELQGIYETGTDAVRLRVVKRWTRGNKGDAK
jgi:hypothetical protein